MSLRYFMRAAQVMKDGVCKNLLKDSAGSSSSQQQKARKFSKAAAVIDSGSGKAAEVVSERFKQAEESLRTVLFLSCWGPN